MSSAAASQAQIGTATSGGNQQAGGPAGGGSQAQPLGVVAGTGVQQAGGPANIAGNAPSTSGFQSGGTQNPPAPVLASQSGGSQSTVAVGAGSQPSGTQSSGGNLVGDVVTHTNYFRLVAEPKPTAEDIRKFRAYIEGFEAQG